MTTVLNLNLNYLSNQFISNLKQQFGSSTQVEIRLRDKSSAEDLFSESEFWQIIDAIDWSKKSSKDKLALAVKKLSNRPVSHIYIFSDKLSEKLYNLDTKQHAQTYAKNEPEQFISVDDFLYARCAVVAEGREYYEKVLKDPLLMPDEIVFEALLNLADDAFELKTGDEFNYHPSFNYETYRNKKGWQ